MSNRGYTDEDLEVRLNWTSRGWEHASQMHIEPVKDPNPPTGGTIWDQAWRQGNWMDKTIIVLFALLVAVGITLLIAL